jgi:hypothetical protein
MVIAFNKLVPSKKLVFNSEIIVIVLKPVAAAKTSF